MDMINDIINSNRFIPIDEEEATALELIGKVVKKTNEVVSEVNDVNNILSKKEDSDNITNKRKLDSTGNFTGAWHGFTKPLMTEPGIQNQVNKNTDDLILTSGEILNLKSFQLMPPSAQPPKKEGYSNNHKIVVKTRTNELMVIQKGVKDYIKYIFNTDGQVGSTEGRDYGVNWELLRLKKAEHITDCYLYTDVKKPELVYFREPSPLATQEIEMFNTFRSDNKKCVGSKGDLGIGVVTIPPNTTVTYQIKTSSKDFNIVYMCTPASSDNVQLSVGNNPLRPINARSSGASFYKRYKENLALNTTPIDATLSITNTHTSAPFYLSAINLVTLEEYRGHSVTDWKAIGSIKSPWIDNDGASEYALVDANGKYFGSYHGGEISEVNMITWKNNNFDSESYATAKQFSEIPLNSFRCIENFVIQQRTKLIESAKMVSIFSFNSNGTLQMDFGLNFYKNVPLKTLYTALTCTHGSFKYLSYPQYITLPLADNGNFEFNVNEGYIKQMNSQEQLELGIRFTKFNEFNNARGTVILNNDTYRKFYYAPFTYAENPIAIDSLTFSKGLDFIIR